MIKEDQISQLPPLSASEELSGRSGALSSSENQLPFASLKDSRNLHEIIVSNEEIMQIQAHKIHDLRAELAAVQAAYAKLETRYSIAIEHLCVDHTTFEEGEGREQQSVGSQ